MTDVVFFESTNGVGRITFERPPANAYDLDFHIQFIAAIEQASTDSTTRVVIVCSAIEGFFCAGADTGVFAQNSTDENKAMVDAARKALAGLNPATRYLLRCWRAMHWVAAWRSPWHAISALLPTVTSR